MSLSTVLEYQNEPNSFFVELLSLYRLLCSALKAAQCLALCEFGVLFLLPADVCEVTEPGWPPKSAQTGCGQRLLGFGAVSGLGILLPTFLPLSGGLILPLLPAASSRRLPKCPLCPEAAGERISPVPEALKGPWGPVGRQ